MSTYKKQSEVLRRVPPGAGLPGRRPVGPSGFHNTFPNAYVVPQNKFWQSCFHFSNEVFSKATSSEKAAICCCCFAAIFLFDDEGAGGARFGIGGYWGEVWGTKCV